MIDSELCSLEEKKDALVKALQSKTFARSEQLKAFLLYICQADTVRPGRPLTEYVIGVEVLGRPEGYSPAEDSSVRTRAYELRQKLDKLYSFEYPHERVRIVVPKGTYSPQYARMERLPDIYPAELQAHTAPSHPEVRVAVIKPSLPRAWIALLLLAAAMAGSASTWLCVRPNPAASDRDPILAEAWGPMAKRDGTVLLSVATPLTLVAGPLDHDVYSSRTYPAPPEAVLLFRQHRPLLEAGQLGFTFSDNMVGIGTMNAALTCANTLRNFGTSYQLLPERVARISALRGRNAIILGAPVDSEAVSVSMEDTPLLVDFEPSLREFVIRDREMGRMIAPKKNANGDFAEVYGLLTVRSSRDVDSKRVQTVLLSGITSVGMQGAAEFFSSPAALRHLRTILAKDRHSGFPASYQVVVHCTFNNLLLLTSTYYTHRVIHDE